MPRTRQDADNITMPEVEEVVFTEEEKKSFFGLIDYLSPEQIHAARLEATGIDHQNISSIIGKKPATIGAWGRKEAYVKARNLFVLIINKIGIKFRLNVQKMLLAPVYGELIKRVSDNEALTLMCTKDLLDIVKVIGKENRLDAATAGGAGGEEADDLQDLQERRIEHSHAEQARKVEQIKDDKKIISFAREANG